MEARAAQSPTTPSRPAPIISLLGKEYFTLPEAAHYCCCSTSQFRSKAPALGIIPAKRFGRTVYRRADCQMYMEQAFSG